MEAKNVIELIDKAKATMTNLGMTEEEQTIEAICIFAKAEQISERKRAFREKIKLGVMDYEL